MKDIVLKTLGNKSSLIILQKLSHTATPSSGRDLAKQTGLSHQTVHQILQHLAESELVSIEKIGASFIYKLNKEHLFIQKCILPLFDFSGHWIEMVGQYYMERLSPKPISIIVFGSLAKEKPKRTSDLDILFVYRDNEFNEQTLSFINQFGSQIFRMCGYQPVPIVAKLSDFKQQAKEGEGLMRTIVREGQIISGALMSELITYDT